MAALTEAQQKAIDDYGSRIKTLKDFMEAVRTRPTMYIGSIGSKGALSAAREIFQNSIDTILDKNSPADWFSYHLDERTGEMTIQDNGTGLPADDIIRILTSAHTSKNFERTPGEYPAGYNGVGAKIVNALSSTYIVESYKYDGTAVRLEFHKGYPTTEKPVSIPNKEKKQGLKTSFILDEDIMGPNELEWKSVYRLIKLMLSTLPLGTRCYFSAVDRNGKEFKEEIINKDGIVTDLIMKVKNPINKPIIIKYDDGYHKLDCAFCYDAGGEEGPDDDIAITSFCNSCPTSSGTHVEGTLEGIGRWFSLYMNNIYLSNQKAKDKLKVIPNDIKIGLNIFISAAHIEPLFNDQAKEILGNEDMVGVCKDAVMKGLDDWSKNNPQDLAKLSKFFKEIAELRMKQEAGKAKIVTKYTKNPLNNLPAKYIKPLKKGYTELLIVEGDSAKGTVQECRDSDTQGIFPIRGKIANAFRMSKTEFFNNAEVQGITQIIFGQEYRKGLTVEDCKVDKIIFVADADVDGAHISALLLRMFVMYYPFLIADGRVFKAIPPLYSIPDGGKKRKYFTDNIDMIKYTQRLFLNNNELLLSNGNSISSKDTTIFLLNNADYLYYLERIAKTYAVSPLLLEMVLNHYVSNGDKVNFAKLKKEVRSAYRFMDVYDEDSTIIVRGTIDSSNLIIVSDKFLADCQHVIDIIRKNNELYYKFNGKLSSIYTIMKAYDKTTPNGIQRYKGLGEMPREQLGESTILPENRTLIKYTMDDAKDTLNAIREYESDSKKILTLVHNVTRDDLVE